MMGTLPFHRLMALDSLGSMETSIFVTDLAQQFSFPSSAPLTLLSSLSGWPEQAGANFLILGLSFLSACQQLASSFVKRT
jgi:hypothetical protein